MGRIWTERLLRWNAKLQGLLKGRYARFDQLSRMLVMVSVFLMLMNIFIGTSIIRWITLILLGVAYYRFFSKKIYTRANENTKYVHFQNQWVNKFQKIKNRFQLRKTYKYFTCPSCKQSLRAPKGKGQIKVTCSSCHQQFTKKV